MLTGRGWSILVCVFLMLGVGMLDRYLFQLMGGDRPGAAANLSRLAFFANTTLELLGLTLGLWFLVEWLRFAFASRVVVRRCRIERTLSDEHGAVDTLWARQTYGVRAVLRLPAGQSLTYVKVADFVPFAAELQDGEVGYEGPLAADHSLLFEYRLRCPAIGALRFEGMRVELADLQGFFYHATFVPDVCVYRVLPPLADSAGNSPSVKRHNVLPPPGVHRLLRPGSGSELLDLRDYLPGDPPKTIAWKVSARRDRLITKEFESEMPVRCTLFVDTSNSVRAGPPGRAPLARLVEIASCAAQGACGGRDLVGLSLFDEQSATYEKPARTSKHLVRIINRLADAAGLPPEADQGRLDQLIPLAHSFARGVHPDLLRAEVNSFPGWLAWLWPTPAYTLRNPTVQNRLYQWLFFWLIGYAVMGLFLLGLGLSALAVMFGRPPARSYEIISLLVVVGVTALLMIVTLLRIPQLFFPGLRRLYRWRKQLAALFSVRHGLAPGGLALLLEDEDYFLRHVQRYLSEHQVPRPIERYDAAGAPLLAAPKKVDVAADALLRAIRRGHDNELYVVLADLLEVADHLDPLVRAVKVAVARHHRVLVICPWPQTEPESLQAQALRLRYQRVKRAFARLGAPVVLARDDQPIRLILGQLDRLRMTGSARAFRR